MLSDLHLQGSSPNEYLQYPATPALSHGPEAQLQAFLRGQQGRNTPIPTLKERLADRLTVVRVPVMQMA